MQHGYEHKLRETRFLFRGMATFSCALGYEHFELYYRIRQLSLPISVLTFVFFRVHGFHCGWVGCRLPFH